MIIDLVVNILVFVAGLVAAWMIGRQASKRKPVVVNNAFFDQGDEAMLAEIESLRALRMRDGELITKLRMEIEASKES